MANDSVTVREFGEQLKRARLDQSRSLDDLAAQTRIHRRHLEAIESGDLSHLPEGPYAKAFIREYSRALGLPVPPEFAVPAAAPKPDAKDPKVVSRPAGASRESEDDSVLPISAVAKETVRFANSAVSSAVKSVAKTTEKMVDFVESGSKEAIEVLTSKTLWDEADQVRRERLGLEPIRPTPVVKAEEPREEPEAIAAPTVSTLQSTLAPRAAGASSRTSEPRVSSRGATNVIIALLVLLFAGAVFYAIRTYKRDSGPVASSKDYVPAPLDKPTSMATPKRTPPVAASSAPAAPAIGPHDSLMFQIHATAPVWVSIAPDGVPAYRGELKSGETRVFKAGDKFDINIGNQKSVTLSLNGRSIANLPTVPNSGVVIRDLVLTRDHAQLGGQTVNIQTLPAPQNITPSQPAVQSSNTVTHSTTSSGTTAASKTTSGSTSTTVHHSTTNSTKPKPKANTIPHKIGPIKPLKPILPKP